MLVILSNEYKYKHNGNHSNICESQFIEISNKTSKKSTVIGNIYRPPKSKSEPLHTFITELKIY